MELIDQVFKADTSNIAFVGLGQGRGTGAQDQAQ